MKHLMFIITTCLILVATNSVLASDVGLLKTLSGDVTITRSQAEIRAVKGMQLKAFDTLSTSKNSTAGIIFTDGTVFTLGPDSEFKMRKYAFEPDIKSYDFSIFIQQGSVVYNSGKIAKLAPDAIAIETPKATVGIRGTRLLITVD